MNERDILHQFDTARLGKFHLALVLLSSMCWALVAYGVTIIGFLIPSLREEWQISSSALGLLAGSGLLGMFIGSIAGGYLADRVGRRGMLVWSLVFSGVFFVLSATAWNYASLLVFRLLMGTGLGAIIPIISTMITEFSPSKERGTLSVIINLFWGLGGTLAAFVGYKVVIEHGWRPALLFGGVAFLFALLIRLFFPESMRFLFRKGRIDEAKKEFSRIHLVPKEDAGTVPAQQDVTLNQSGSTGGLWSKKYARITFVLWFMWFGLNFLYQGAFVWLPTLLASTQVSQGRSFLLTILISLGQVPGTLIVTFLADRTQRARLLMLSMLLLASAALLLGFSQNDTWILVVGFILMVFNGMTWGMAYSYSAELYPTRMRASATGWAAGVGRLGGVPAPILVGWVVQQGGSLMLVFGLLALAPFLATLMVSTVKADTTGKSLEAISAD